MILPVNVTVTANAPPPIVSSGNGGFDAFLEVHSRQLASFYPQHRLRTTCVAIGRGVTAFSPKNDDESASIGWSFVCAMSTVPPDLLFFILTSNLESSDVLRTLPTYNQYRHDRTTNAYNTVVASPRMSRILILGVRGAAEENLSIVRLVDRSTDWMAILSAGSALNSPNGFLLDVCHTLLVANSHTKFESMADVAAGVRKFVEFCVFGTGFVESMLSRNDVSPVLTFRRVPVQVCAQHARWPRTHLSTNSDYCQSPVQLPVNIWENFVKDFAGSRRRSVVVPGTRHACVTRRSPHHYTRCLAHRTVVPIDELSSPSLSTNAVVMLTDIDTGTMTADMVVFDSFTSTISRAFASNRWCMLPSLSSAPMLCKGLIAPADAYKIVASCDHGPRVIPRVKECRKYYLGDFDLNSKTAGPYALKDDDEGKLGLKTKLTALQRTAVGVIDSRRESSILEYVGTPIYTSSDTDRFAKYCDVIGDTTRPTMRPATTSSHSPSYATRCVSLFATNGCSRVTLDRVNRLANTRVSLLHMSTGAGKTLTTLACIINARKRHLENGGDRPPSTKGEFITTEINGNCVVLVPDMLVLHWVSEVTKHTDLKEDVDFVVLKNKSSLSSATKTCELRDKLAVDADDTNGKEPETTSAAKPGEKRKRSDTGDDKNKKKKKRRKRKPKPLSEAKQQANAKSVKYRPWLFIVTPSAVRCDLWVSSRAVDPIRHSMLFLAVDEVHQLSTNNKAYRRFFGANSTVRHVGHAMGVTATIAGKFKTIMSTLSFRSIDGIGYELSRLRSAVTMTGRATYPDLKINTVIHFLHPGDYVQRAMRLLHGISNKEIQGSHRRVLRIYERLCAGGNVDGELLLRVLQRLLQPVSPLATRSSNTVRIDVRPARANATTYNQARDECVICMCNFDDPVELSCGHVLCKVCLTSLLSLSRRRCPTCRSNINVSSGTVTVYTPTWSKKKPKSNPTESKLSQEEQMAGRGRAGQGVLNRLLEATGPSSSETSKFVTIDHKLKEFKQTLDAYVAGKTTTDRLVVFTKRDVTANAYRAIIEDAGLVVKVAGACRAPRKSSLMAISEFRSGRGDVLLCNFAYSTGFDLHNVSTIIICDFDIKLSSLIQAKGRVTRIGQKNNKVNIHILLTIGGLDQVMYYHDKDSTFSDLNPYRSAMVEGAMAIADPQSACHKIFIRLYDLMQKKVTCKDAPWMPAEHDEDGIQQKHNINFRVYYDTSYSYGRSRSVSGVAQIHYSGGTALYCRFNPSTGAPLLDARGNLDVSVGDIYRRRRWAAVDTMLFDTGLVV